MQELLNLQELAVSDVVAPAISCTSCDSTSCN